jgi:hypothetical protein
VLSGVAFLRERVNRKILEGDTLLSGPLGELLLVVFHGAVVSLFGRNAHNVVFC